MSCRSSTCSRSTPRLLLRKRQIARDHIAGAVPGYCGHRPSERDEVQTILVSSKGTVQAPLRSSSSSALPGYDHAANGIPGYTGHIPGKQAENVYADTWARSHSRSLAAHFTAQAQQPRKLCVVTEGGTLVAAKPSDALREMPIRNSAYNDHIRGWSICDFTGANIDPAGRLPPRDRQESFGGMHGNVNATGNAPIPGYAGWVPGHIGENAFGERQCRTRATTAEILNVSRMRAFRQPQHGQA